MHTEEKHIDIDQLITSYLSGDLDKESFDILKQWSEKSEANRKYVRDRLEIWFSSGVAGDELVFDQEKALLQFKQRVSNTQKQKYTPRRIPWKIVYRVAAVILILLLPWMAYRQGKETGKEDFKQTFANMVVEAPLGARSKLYLPDGTLVWLNAGSKIIYSQGFGVEERNLELVGEGYFEVTRNEKIPFKVNTQEVNLTVLGTRFNFRNYPDDEEVTVNLMAGKVALHNEVVEMPDLHLEANEKMILNKLTGEMIKSTAHVEFANAWAEDELFFDEDLLEDIAKRLMRSYDVKIEVADSLRHRRFYGSFKITGSNINEVLDIMATTNIMKYRYEDGKYILY